MTVDQAVEAYTEKLVQEAFEEDKSKKDSIKALWEADYMMLKAREAIAFASTMIKGTPDSMRIDSLWDSVDNIMSEIYKQIVWMGGK